MSTYAAPCMIFRASSAARSFIPLCNLMIWYARQKDMSKSEKAFMEKRLRTTEMYTWTSQRRHEHPINTIVAI